MNNIKIKFKKLTPTAQLPRYAHEGDSGMDICADETVGLTSMDYSVISTGIAAVIPNGYELQVRPRSGLAAKNAVVAAFGTVDTGYRGEIKVTLFNHGWNRYTVNRGDRIAQLVLAPVVRADIEETDDICEETDRGTNGFGSTGV